MKITGMNGSLTNGSGAAVNGGQAVAQPTIQQAVATVQQNNMISQVTQPTIQDAITGGSTGTMAAKNGVNPWNGIAYNSLVNANSNYFQNNGLDFYN
jgi:hypothetical protein